ANGCSTDERMGTDRALGVPSVLSVHPFSYPLTVIVLPTDVQRMSGWERIGRLGFHPFYPFIRSRIR
ncbi:MAG: hypothetical protein NZM11_11310, partial [Anaerolineales bacterium]|nr:hypothetical protein [Anaerolineales bacterium]